MKAHRMNLSDLLNSAGVVVLVTTAGNLIAKYLERRDRYKSAIRKISEIYDGFNRVIDDSKADRVLILKSHNGGGKPTPGTDLYVSIIHEMSTKGVEQIKQQYQRILIDDTYIRIIQQIILERTIEIRIQDLPENSFIRLTYEKDNLKWIYFFEIKGNANSYFFGSFSTKDEKGFTPGDKLAFKLAIDKFKRIFENEN